MVFSARLPVIAPLDNVRRYIPPNRHVPRRQTLIKDGTSGRGHFRDPSRAPNSASTGAAPEPAGLWRFTGRAVLDVFLPRRADALGRAEKNVKGGNLGQPRPGAAVHVAKEAVGARSAWSQSFPVTRARPR